MADTEELDQQSLVDHLTELRKRLINAIIFIVLGFAACWSFSEILFDILRRPIAPFLSTDTGGLVFTAPMDKFLAHLKVSFLGGFIITAPAWLYQVWRFIAPGLYAEEKKYGVGFIFTGSILFFVGVSFVYFVVYPLAFEFLMGFGGSKDIPMITIAEYISFFTTTTIIFGLVFEMPLILTILGIMGVVTSEALVKYRRYALVALATVSAVITPPDVISMGLMLIPMFLLYESSIVLVRIFGKKVEDPTL